MINVPGYDEWISGTTKTLFIVNLIDYQNVLEAVIGEYSWALTRDKSNFLSFINYGDFESDHINKLIIIFLLFFYRWAENFTVLK